MYSDSVVRVLFFVKMSNCVRTPQLGKVILEALGSGYNDYEGIFGFISTNYPESLPAQGSRRKILDALSNQVKK